MKEGGRSKALAGISTKETYESAGSGVRVPPPPPPQELSKILKALFWGGVCKVAKGEGQERCSVLWFPQYSQTQGCEACVIAGEVAKLEGQKFTCMRDPGGPGI